MPNVTVELTDEEYERLRGVADDPTALASEAVRERIALAEAATFTRNGEFREGARATDPDVPGVPIGRLLGFEIEAAGEGTSRVTMTPGPEHANPMGTLHGGVLCDLGDAAMGTAFASTLDADESFTTLELTCRFLRPVWDEPLVAEGRVSHRGSTVGQVTCEVTTAGGKPVARLESTCLVLRGEAADGR